jgi:hypothetical protein
VACGGGDLRGDVAIVPSAVGSVGVLACVTSFFCSSLHGRGEGRQVGSLQRLMLCSSLSLSTPLFLSLEVLITGNFILFR